MELTTSGAKNASILLADFQQIKYVMQLKP